MGTEPAAALSSTPVSPDEVPVGPDETPVAPDGAPVKKRRGYFIPGIIALVVLLVIGLVLGGGDLEHPAATTIYGSAIESQIANGIQDVRDTNATIDVACPAQEPVKQGLQFSCTATGAGLENQTVYVVETDGRGDTRWSLTPP